MNGGIVLNQRKIDFINLHRAISEMKYIIHIYVIWFNTIVTELWDENRFVDGFCRVYTFDVTKRDKNIILKLIKLIKL